MSPPVDLVTSDKELPAQVDVVVIGGGILGSSAAFYLAARGVSVLLCEKGRIGGEQSSRNWGWVRKMGRDPAEIPLSIAALNIWEGLNQLLGRETGFRRTGITYTFEHESQLQYLVDWQRDYGNPAGIQSRVVTGRAAADLVPGAARPFTAALVTPSDGRGEPSKAAPAIAQGARDRGAHVMTDCAVRGIETTAGRISAVVTEKGTVRCGSVILAGGAWSRLFCKSLGIDLPQLKVLSSAMRTAPMDGPTEGAVGGVGFAFRKRLDGGYTVARRGVDVSPIVPDSFKLFFDYMPEYVKNWRSLRLRVNGRFLTEWQTPGTWRLDQPSPFEKVRILDPEPNQRILREARQNIARAFPAFANMQVAGTWAGLIDVTPDAVPVMAEVPRIPGFFIATGLSGHGFGVGPAAGHLMADLVTGAKPIVDPSPFRLDRFERLKRTTAA